MRAIAVLRDLSSYENYENYLLYVENERLKQSNSEIQKQNLMLEQTLGLTK